MVLLLIESEGKRKKIEEYTGHTCMATKGHLMDIPSNIKWFNPEKVEDPEYIINPLRKDVVRNLKKESKKHDKILIMTDADREGEAIGFNVAKILGLDVNKTDRIRFNQISKKVLLDAIANPDKLNQSIFSAQKARRIVDILFGFMISPLLWKYVQYGISAGRCQSPALKLILDRQRESINSNQSKSFHASIVTKATNKIVKRKDTIENNDKKNIESWMTKIMKAGRIIINDTKKTNSNKSSPPAFTTSSFQQDIYSYMGIDPKNTMKIAQKLYENGYITYMRTDSTYLGNVKEIHKYITEKFDESLTNQPKMFKKKNAQEAHEAIRPINLYNFPPNNTVDYKVYMRIWKRTIAACMKPAIYEVNHYDCSIIDQDAKIIENKWFIEEKFLIYEGYLKLSRNDDLVSSTENKLYETCNIKRYEKEHLEIIETLNVEEKTTHPPALYNTGDLVKLFEKTGIGRPSTFSNIIEKIIERNYITIGTQPSQEIELFKFSLSESLTLKEDILRTKLGGKKNVCLVTPLGEKVTEFLETNCYNMILPEFTSKLESSLDDIVDSTDLNKWKSVVREFYNSVKDIQSSIVPNSSLCESDQSIKWIRKFNDDTKTTIGIVHNRYGYVLAKGNDTKIETYISLPPKSDINEMTEEEAKNLFQFPKKINESTEICIGRYGWYLKHNGKNVKVSVKENMKGPNYQEIEEAIQISENPTSIEIKKISNCWSLRQNCEKKTYFIMKNEKNKVKFYSLSDEVDLSSVTEIFCNEVAELNKKTKRKWPNKKK